MTTKKCRECKAAINLSTDCWYANVEGVFFCEACASEAINKNYGPRLIAHVGANEELHYVTFCDDGKPGTLTGTSDCYNLDEMLALYRTYDWCDIELIARDDEKMTALVRLTRKELTDVPSCDVGRVGEWGEEFPSELRGCLIIVAALGFLAFVCWAVLRG